MWLKFLRGSSFGSTTHEGVVYCLQSTLANHVFIFSTAILKSIIQPRWNKNFLLTIAIFTFQVFFMLSVTTVDSYLKIYEPACGLRWCYAWLEHPAFERAFWWLSRPESLWPKSLGPKSHRKNPAFASKVNLMQQLGCTTRIEFPHKVFQDSKYSRVFWCWTSNHSLNNLMASEPYLLRADSVAPPSVSHCVHDKCCSPPCASE